MERFDELKSKILRVAKYQSACSEQYKRAYAAETMAALCGVIKDNFHWCCNSEVITGALIDEFKADFGKENIFHNEAVIGAYLVATGQSTVEAYDQSTVRAYDQSTVVAYGQSAVRATGQSTVVAYGQSAVVAYGQSAVRAYDQSTVVATGQSTVIAYGQSAVVAYDQSAVRAYDQSTVRAYDQSAVRAYDQSTVEATGQSYINSFSSIECKISENAILRHNGVVTCCGKTIKTN